MAITTPPDQGPVVLNLPDMDLHELTGWVRSLLQDSKAHMDFIVTLRKRVTDLEDLLGGRAQKDVHINGTVTAKDVVLT